MEKDYAAFVSLHDDLESAYERLKMHQNKLEQKGTPDQKWIKAFLPALPLHRGRLRSSLGGYIIGA